MRHLSIVPYLTARKKTKFLRIALFTLSSLVLLLSSFTLSPSHASQNITIHNADLYQMPMPMQMQLVKHVKTYVNNVANHIYPHKEEKYVEAQGDAYIARYLVIDRDSARMEALPHEQGKTPKIILTYHEIEYQCTGATKHAALNGQFIPCKTRRLIEILQYANGTWH